MDSPPFSGEGYQGAPLFEIPATERLQRVLCCALGDHVLAPTRAQVVAQLGDQDGWRLLAVVAHTVPAPADIEHLSCGKQRLEHELAVVIAP